MSPRSSIWVIPDRTPSPISRTRRAHPERSDEFAGAVRAAPDSRGSARIAHEDDELEGVGRARLRQHLPQHAEDRLRNRHGPHRAIEVTPLVPFALCRWLDSRQQAKGAEKPHGADDRKIRDVVHLPQLPGACHDGHDEPGDVQHGEGDDLAPGQRVADAAVERVRTIFSKSDDVGTGLDAGQAAKQAGNAGTDENGQQPQRHPPVEPVREQVECQRPGRDEEHEDPDRPVRQSVIDLVPFPDAAVCRELDTLRVTVPALVGRGK